MAYHETQDDPGSFEFPGFLLRKGFYTWPKFAPTENFSAPANPQGNFGTLRF